jgi:hypothetical protein
MCRAVRTLTIVALVGIGVSTASVLGMLAMYAEDLIDEARAVAAARAAR